MPKTTSIIIALLCLSSRLKAQITNVGEGWANNSVNTVVFRKNSLVSFKDTQYIAYYDKDQYVVLGKRGLNSKTWEIKKTSFKGNTADAHNSISIMVDGKGYLHMAWDHHGNALHYAKGKTPETMVAQPMTGSNETNVTYPEFHRLPNGNLIFLYRAGRSGQGDLVINRYTDHWEQLHTNLIDGENQRNAYWQACIDKTGTIHISWVWRESPDVSSNHDLCYARSTDGGVTWEKSTGEKYQLPINAKTAEYICHIPQKSELINQTSMYADDSPIIASYWRDQNDSVPQYHIVYRKNNTWHTENLHTRKTPFTLGGTGTKRIPVSRPQVVAWKNNIALIFRDEERGNSVSIAIKKRKWQIKDLLKENMGSWEPSFDTELWRQQQILDLFIQYTDQKDGEGQADIAPTMVKVLEWDPGK